MSAASLTFVRSLPVWNTLGECPIWDFRTGSLWWTDIESRALWRWQQHSDLITAFGAPERVGSFALTDDPDILVCGFESGLARFAPERGDLDWLVRMPELASGCRLNDGRVDREGRFWVGSMDEAGGVTPPRGALHRLDGGDSYATFIHGVQISNGLCFSPSGDWLYFADSPTGTIARHRYGGGQLGPGETVFTAPTGVHPDGAAVDSEGWVWSAQWGDGSVVRLNPETGEHVRFEVPCPQPTCVSFGGSDLTTLFVTTAAVGLSSDELAQWPQSGAVFVYRSSVPGIRESICSVI